MKKVQVHLARGPFRRTCWVDADPRVKPGNSLSLKGSTARWDILTVSEPQERSDLHTDWHVGGL